MFTATAPMSCVAQKPHATKDSAMFLFGFAPQELDAHFSERICLENMDAVVATPRSHQLDIVTNLQRCHPISVPIVRNGSLILPRWMPIQSDRNPTAPDARKCETKVPNDPIV